MLARFFTILHDLLALISIFVACAVNLVRFNSRPKQVEWAPKHETVLVIGNGPSAGPDLRSINLKLYSAKVGVNHFASTDWFLEVRPEYYFIQDGYWFSPENGAMKQSVRETLIDLDERVDWPMSLFIPAKHFGLFTKLGRISNPLISVKRMTAASLTTGEVVHFAYRSFTYQKLIFRLWSHRILPLPATNIVSTALFELLSRGYKKLDIVGLDMSMAQDLQLDRQGKVSFTPSHFYGKADTPEVPKGSELDTMALAYEWIASKFRVFDLLAKYSLYLGAEVLNRSSVTLLDSFQQSPLARPGVTSNK